MITYIRQRRCSFCFRRLNILLIGVFAWSSIIPLEVQAQTAPTGPLNLPVPGTMVTSSAAFVPPLLKGLKVHPENPFEFEFVVDSGDSNVQDTELKAESKKLIKYFLASLTIPEEELWVNLSPHEPDRIIPNELGQTEMGRDLLAQDYILKQLTASLLYPKGEFGKKFWERVYQTTYAKYGTTEIPMNTFNKVWIVPDKAVVYENGSVAFVVESRLKAMMEEDYLAKQKNAVAQKSGHPDAYLQDHSGDWEPGQRGRLSPEILKEIILPEIEREINEGEHFFQLRQIYHSLILAAWFKRRLKQSILGHVYVDQHKIQGVDHDDQQAKQKIYDRYVQAYKKGVYDYIREYYDSNTQQTIPRKYFSGGALFTKIENTLIMLPSHLAIPGESSKPVGVWYLLSSVAREIDSKSVGQIEVPLMDVSKNLVKLPSQLDETIALRVWLEGLRGNPSYSLFLDRLEEKFLKARDQIDPAKKRAVAKLFYDFSREIYREFRQLGDRLEKVYQGLAQEVEKTADVVVTSCSACAFHVEGGDTVWSKLRAYVEGRGDLNVEAILENGHAAKVAEELYFVPGRLLEGVDSVEVGTTLARFLRQKTAEETDQVLVSLARVFADHIDQLAIKTSNGNGFSSRGGDLDIDESDQWKFLPEILDVPYFQEIGEHIKTLRIKKEKVRNRAAERMGISKIQLGKIEHGIMSGSTKMSTFIKISNFLKIPLFTLLTGRPTTQIFRIYPEDFRSYFGKNIYWSRKRQGWGQQELEDETKIKKSDISRIEAGKLMPDLKRFISLVRALKVSPDQLVRFSVYLDQEKKVVETFKQWYFLPEEIKIGKRVRALREARGETQDDVARAIGVVHYTISDIEIASDRNYLDLKIFSDLADHFGVSLFYLLTGRETQQHFDVRILENLGPNIQKLRGAQRLSQKFIDPTNNLVAIEKGRKIPKTIKFVSIARALRVPPDLLLASDEEVTHYIERYLSFIEPSDQWRFLLDDLQSIGAWIRAHREMRGLTLEEVGKRLGIAEKILLNIESGVLSKIPLKIIVELADLFQVSVFSLLTGRITQAEAERRRFVSYGWNGVKRYLGVNLERIMKEKKVFSGDLQIALGVSQTTISKVKKGSVGVLNFINLVRVLKSSVDDLLDPSQEELYRVIDRIYDLEDSDRDAAEYWLVDKLSWKEIEESPEYQGKDMLGLRKRILNQLRTAGVMQEDGALTPWKVLEEVKVDAGFSDGVISWQGFDSFELERTTLGELASSVVELYDEGDGEVSVDTIRSLIVAEFRPNNGGGNLLEEAQVRSALARLAVLFQNHGFTVAKKILLDAFSLDQGNDQIAHDPAILTPEGGIALQPDNRDFLVEGQGMNFFSLDIACFDDDEQTLCDPAVMAQIEELRKTFVGFKEIRIVEMRELSVEELPVFLGVAQNAEEFPPVDSVLPKLLGIMLKRSRIIDQLSKVF